MPEDDMTDMDFLNPYIFYSPYAFMKSADAYLQMYTQNPFNND